MDEHEPREPDRPDSADADRGKWVEAASGEVLNVENPARRQVITRTLADSANAGIAERRDE